MHKELKKLSSQELELMMKAPLLVCILIAGADSKIDEKEINGAMRLARKGTAKANLTKYFELVTEDFEDKLKILLQSLPKESSKRASLIDKELSQLNFIAKKLSKPVATDFYKSLLYIARTIAEASGGILGMKKVGEEEMKLVTLPMLKDPATY